MGEGDTVGESFKKAWDAADTDFSDAPVGSPTAPCPCAEPVRADAKTNLPKECAFLGEKQSNAKMPREGYDRLRTGKKSVSAKKDAPNYKWPNGSTAPPASVQEVDVDGQKVKVYSPKNDKDAENMPTADQVAEAMRAMPQEQRKHTKEVVLDPHPAADGTGSGGAAGNGTVELRRTEGTPTQRNVDYRMTHEAGHNYQEQHWKSKDDVDAWGAAAKADGKSPSNYADESPGEDFCEFLNIYNVTKGTPCEATAKQMYPNRWKKMQAYEAAGK